MEQHPQLAQLRADAERLVKEGRWVLRLTTHVALGGIGAVGIVSSRGGDAVVVRFWDFKADLERLAAGEGGGGAMRPTIHERQFAANAEQSRALVRQLGVLSVPVLPDAGELTVDGVLYEIYCEQGQHSTTMRWVSTAPKGWETLGVWFTAAWSGLSHGVGGGGEENET